jgi:hypothetical protein
MVDHGSGQGHWILETAGVAALRRGFRKSENAGMDRKMPFMDGHLNDLYRDLTVMKKTIPLTLLFLLTMLSPAFSDLPTTPTGLTLVAASSSITVTWTANTDNATSGYYIYYYKSSDTASVTRVTFPVPTTTASSYSKILAGLDNNTQYTVQLSAYNSSGESAYVSGTMTTSTVSLSINLVSQGAVKVAVDNTSADFAYYDLYMGTSPVTPDIYGNRDLTEYNVLAQTWINISSSYTKEGLSNGTYYILVQIRYPSGTVIFTSEETAFTVEDFKTLFSSQDNIKSGCFIESSDNGSHESPWGYLVFIVLFPFLFLKNRTRHAVIMGLAALFISATSHADESVNPGPNIVGLKFGYLLPSEKIQKDVYDTITPFTLFYERKIGSLLSADVSIGYARCKGYAVTASSSTQTGVNATLDFIPVSMSLNVNHDVDPLITLYAGLGGDVWVFNEKSFYGKSDKNIPGYHGKAGVKLLTGDTDF